ncbi:MAG TPA: PspC domain-containing protein [Candidatus Acidoferrales bacterium]|nr:PspC domain-containing protein [Candidatus Acidoferrales bacterium]
MNKVITVNLNGNAYQLEETGYDALRAYLDEAAAKLAGNPDRDEIISDIEQAVADKLRTLLGPYKNVAAAAQVSAIIAEMGPVDTGTETPANEPPPREKTGATGDAQSTAKPDAARRLYRLYDGAMISGVCNGIAAYINLDPTIVRLLAVIATILTGGTGILAYFIMVVVIPEASTEAEKNAAHGAAPFTAQEYIRRARAGYYEGMKGFPDRAARRAWQRKFKEEMRAWRRSFKWEAYQGARAWQSHWHSYWAEHPYQETGWGIALPFLTFFSAAMTVGFIIAVISLLTSGTLAGLALPSGVPVWLAIVLLLIAYNLIVWPIKVARHVFYRYGIYGGRPGPRVFLSLWEAFIWIIFVGVLAWLAFTHLPEVQAAVRNIPVVFHDAKDSIQQWWSHH